MDVIFNWIIQYSYPVLFALLMLGIVGLPLPDETLLTFAGYLVFVEELALLPTIGAAVGKHLRDHVELRSWTQSRSVPCRSDRLSGQNLPW